MISERRSAPLVSRASHTLTVRTYNTFSLVAGDIYTLVTPYAGPYFYNVLNLGFGTLYIRADADPARNDVQSETLPAFNADNLILVPEGTEGLRFLAGPPYADDTDQDDSSGIVGGAKITVRLVRG